MKNNENEQHDKAGTFDPPPPNKNKKNTHREPQGAKKKVGGA